MQKGVGRHLKQGATTVEHAVTHEKKKKIGGTARKGNTKERSK